MKLLGQLMAMKEICRPKTRAAAAPPRKFLANQKGPELRPIQDWDTLRHSGNLTSGQLLMA